MTGGPLYSEPFETGGAARLPFRVCVVTEAAPTEFVLETSEDGKDWRALHRMEPGCGEFSGWLPLVGAGRWCRARIEVPLSQGRG